MNRGAVAVFSRFISDPAQMTTPDPATIVFDCGTPQPLFLTALASTYGPQIVNAKVAMEHEEDGDFGNAWMTTQRRGNRHRRLDAGLVRTGPGGRSWSGTRATGAAGKGITSSGSSSASSKSSRRCASWSKPATSTSWTASASTFDAIDELQQVPTLTVDHLRQHRGRLLHDDRGGSAGLARGAAGDVLRLPLSGGHRRRLQRLRVASEQPGRPVGARLPGGRILLRDRPRQGEGAARRGREFRREPS